MTKILVVDDDSRARLLYLRELSATGYSVQIAESGQQALQLFAENPPDLVVLDIRMPGLDGIDLAGRMVAQNCRVPIILHTAYSCYRDNYLSWVADAYVRKSSDLTELQSAIRRLLPAPHTDALPGRFIRAGNAGRVREADRAHHMKPRLEKVSW